MNQVLPAGLLYETAAESESPIFSEAESRGFGELHLFSDSTLNLRAVIAIHSTARGPALSQSRPSIFSPSD